MTTAREIRLKSRPNGLPTHDNFELATVELPDPAPGEVQVKNLWMTVDPYMRGRMNDVKSYVAALRSSARSWTAAPSARWWPPMTRTCQVGDLVQSGYGWREGFNASGGAKPCRSSIRAKACPSRRSWAPPACPA